jgi:hypothetical protein
MICFEKNIMEDLPPRDCYAKNEAIGKQPHTRPTIF